MRSDKKIPWIFIAISLIFAFNPSISIIDPLPDFLGYILLSFALSRLAVLNSTIAEAKRAFEWMILIDGGKILAVMWVFGMEALSERNTSVLVWCFAFAVLEGIFLIPAYLKLFSGISEIGDLYPSDTIHRRISGRGRSVTERIRNFSVGFLIFRALMNVLPELSVLSETSNNEVAYHASLYRYIGVMRGICILPALVVGIVWAVKMVKYFKELSGDTQLNPALAQAHKTKEETRRGLFIKSNVRTACWFLVAAAVLTLDIRLERVNIVPDVITVALFIPALLYFARDTQIQKKQRRRIHALIWIYGAVSVIAQLLEAYYIDNFTYNAMNKNITAFVFYLISVISVALQGGVFICLLSAFFKEIRGVIVDHTGYVLGKEIRSEGEDMRVEEVHKEISRSFTLAFDAAMLYVLSDVVYSLYGAFYAFANVNLGFLNVVNLACGALFIGMTVKATGELREAVNTKYMLE